MSGDTRALEYDYSILDGLPYPQQPYRDNTSTKESSGLDPNIYHGASLPQGSSLDVNPLPRPKPFFRRKPIIAILVITSVVLVIAIVAGIVGGILVRRRNQAAKDSGPQNTSENPDTQNSTFQAVLSGIGIGGYDLSSPADQIFAFDYDHSGKADHLALYRPGTGTFWILENQQNGSFVPVYQQGDPGIGIGGYDLKSIADRAFAFDYEHSGRLDYLAFYRPGTGTFWILWNQNGSFSPVYQQGDPGIGIGGYDLASGDDRAFAFDYESSGRLDYIALYRPGTGTFWILRNQNGTFSPVYQQGDPGIGIGGYDLRSAADRAFSFDYDHSGKLDHLAFFRPGTGTFWILKNSGGNFSPVYRQGDPGSGSGVGGYNLDSTADRVFAYDYNHTGKLDHLVCYRPGRSSIFILENQGGQFSPVYEQDDPGDGIGGYDLSSTSDLAMAFDYSSDGKTDALVLYRPGTGKIAIVTHGQ